LSLDVKQKIEEELRALETELKIDLPRELQKAAALGDLRENGEYQSARQRQDIVRARVAALRARLSELAMINMDNLPHDRAAYGSVLELYDIEKSEDVTYRLVMPEEADLSKGLISTASPIGQSLMGKREGDEVKVRTPSGVRTFEITKLTTIHDS